MFWPTEYYSFPARTLKALPLRLCVLHPVPPFPSSFQTFLRFVPPMRWMWMWWKCWRMWTIDMQSWSAKAQQWGEWETELRALCEDPSGWTLAYDRKRTRVWTRKLAESDHMPLQMIKTCSEFADVSANLCYDVLQVDKIRKLTENRTRLGFWCFQDTEYRLNWDKHMLRTVPIGFLNPNNDICYYASRFLHFLPHLLPSTSSWRPFPLSQSRLCTAPFLARPWPRKVHFGPLRLARSEWVISDRQFKFAI